ncbi:hypothetical protein K7432_016086 [Basidiobolus ranarum]|uniref:Uncharacterized protein n=1 Tax=Basidiobolus ranarum TaxID=34480 RepID=A0ABR2WF72_9FUNG
MRFTHGLSATIAFANAISALQQSSPALDNGVQSSSKRVEAWNSQSAQSNIPVSTHSSLLSATTEAHLRSFTTDGLVSLQKASSTAKASKLTNVNTMTSDPSMETAHKTKSEQVKSTEKTVSLLGSSLQTKPSISIPVVSKIQKENEDPAIGTLPDTVSVYSTYTNYQTYTEPPSIIVETTSQLLTTNVGSESVKETHFETTHATVIKKELVTDVDVVKQTTTVAPKSEAEPHTLTKKVTKHHTLTKKESKSPTLVIQTALDTKDTMKRVTKKKTLQPTTVTPTVVVTKKPANKGR